MTTGINMKPNPTQKRVREDIRTELEPQVDYILYNLRQSIKHELEGTNIGAYKEDVQRYKAELLNLTTSAMQRAYEAGHISWLRSEIEKLDGMKIQTWDKAFKLVPKYGEHTQSSGNGDLLKRGYNQALTSIITRYKEELLELDKTNGL